MTPPFTDDEWVLILEGVSLFVLECQMGRMKPEWYQYWKDIAYMEDLIQIIRKGGERPDEEWFRKQREMLGG